MHENRNSTVNAVGEIVASNGVGAEMVRSTQYVIECWRNGEKVWSEEFHNLVTTEGLNDSLDKHFKGSGYTAAWYVGLTAGSPTFAAGDTMASHGGWTEIAAYSESVRQTLTLGSVSVGSVSNTASKATFTINASTTVGGAFLASNSTKSGTTGVLYGGGAFSANRTLYTDDVLTVTITLSATSG